MSDSSFLNASNIQKLNKELNDLKSRKVLTDLLNSQIDVNEHLSQENNTLIVNQRKLLNLIESKDRVIEEIKAGTVSFCDQGYDENTADHSMSTYRQIQIQSFQNKAQILADHQWQMSISKIQQGVLILKILYEKQAIQYKYTFFERLKEIRNQDEIQQSFHQVQMKTQQNQLLRLYSLFKALLSLTQKRKKIGFVALSQNYMRSIQQQIFEEEQANLVHRLQTEFKDKNDPMKKFSTFYELLKKNKSISTNKKTIKQGNIQQKIRITKVDGLKKLPFAKSTSELTQKLQLQNVMEQSSINKLIQKFKLFDKLKTFPKRLQAIISCQRERISQLLKEGITSQDQVKEFILKTQMIVNKIQTDYNMKCQEIDFLNIEKTKTREVHEKEIEDLEQQLEDIRSQREQQLLNLKENQDIQSKYQQKCLEIEELTEQNQHNQIQLQEQIDAYEQKFEEFQAVHDEAIRELEETQGQYHQIASEKEQIAQQKDEEAKRYKEQIQQLKNQVEEIKNSGLTEQQTIIQNLQISEQQNLEKVQKLQQILEEGENEKKGYEELIQRLQRTISQNKQNEENYKHQLGAIEQRNEALKKELLQIKQINREFEIQKEESSLEIETVSKRVQHLQKEKENLVNNLEISVMNLKELKQSHDHISMMLNKNKEEKTLLFQELEEKENIILQLNEKVLEAERRVKDANRRASASPNRTQERDDAVKKFNKVKKEKEELEGKFEEIAQKLQKTKQINQELTKDAIEMNQEKLQMSEAYDNLYHQLEDRDNTILQLQDKFQTLLQKLEEKDIQIQKLSIKPELFQKLAQDKLELEEENHGLKNEILNIHSQIQNMDIQKKKLQQEIKDSKDQIKEINQIRDNLTRDKIGYLRENSEKQHEVSKLKKINEDLKNECDEYQNQIEDYKKQLEVFLKAFQSMDSKIKSLENRSHNTMLEAMGEIKQTQGMSNSAISNNRSEHNTSQIENIDINNLNSGQQLIKRIDHMKSMFTKQN